MDTLIIPASTSTGTHMSDTKTTQSDKREDTFVSEGGASVRRVSDSTVAVAATTERGEILYILPVPEKRGSYDSAERWLERAKSLRTKHSKARHLAIVEFLQKVEPGESERPILVLAS